MKWILNAKVSRYVVFSRSWKEERCDGLEVKKFRQKYFHKSSACVVE